MRLKRFTAPTMAEAIKLIKHDLGKDAVILSTRKIEKNGKPSLEITAGIDKPLETPTLPKVTVNEVPKSKINKPKGLTDYLMRHGVDTEISGKIISAVDALASTGFDELDTLDMVINKMVPFVAPTQALQKNKAHIFIGPTGGGKTSTLSKLAIDKRLAGNSISLLTMDNKKIGAFEQLHIIASAMKQDAHVITSLEDFNATNLTLGPRDFMFIDTPGISPFNRNEILELKKRIDELGLDPHVHLVLPSCLNNAEMTAIPAAYQVLNPQTIIFTKLDETAHMGGLINVAVMSGLNICYITDGAQIPGDIVEIDAASLAKKLTKPPRFPWEEI